MTKTYLVSEEVLREVLDALDSAHTVVVTGKSNNSQEWDIDTASKTIRTILASPPAEPHSWVMKTKEEMAKDNRSFMQPLYTKDAP